MLRQVARRARKPLSGHSDRFRAQLKRLVRANATGYAITILVAPLLSRLYTPEAFGGFGLFLAFLTLTGGLGGMRYEAGIVSARSREEARHLTVLALGAAAILGGITAAIYGVSVSFGWFGAGALPLWTAAVLLASIVMSVGYSAFRYLLYFLGDVRAVARGVVAQSFGRGTAQVLLGVLHPVPGALIVGEFLGRAAGVGAVAFAARTLLRRPLPSVRAIAETGRRYYTYPLYSLPSSLSDAAVGFLPLPAIAAMYGLHAAGLYAFVQRVVALPVGVLGKAVADTYHTELASTIRATDARAYALFMRTFRTLAVAAALLAIGLAAGGLALFEPMLGSEWEQGGVVLAILAPVTAANIAVAPLGRTVFVLGGQRQKFAYDAIALGLVMLSITTAWVAGFGFLLFLALLTTSHLVARAAYFRVLQRMVRNWEAGGAAGRADRPAPAPD